MERGLKEDYVTYIYRIENVMVREEEMQQLSYSGGEEPNQRPKSPRKADGKVGRNDPCPCGSGKKYKKCGLLNTPEHQRLMSQGGSAA
jgi:preprotein translocase subunit SecA